MFSNQIDRFRGDTYADTITVKADGMALNVSGYSFIFSLSGEEMPITADYIYQITGSIIDEAGGVVEFAPTDGDADQTPGLYYYDIQMTDTLGRKKTIAKGKYKYIQDITKD